MKFIYHSDSGWVMKFDHVDEKFSIKKRYSLTQINSMIREFNSVQFIFNIVYDIDDKGNETHYNGTLVKEKEFKQVTAEHIFNHKNKFIKLTFTENLIKKWVDKEYQEYQYGLPHILKTYSYNLGNITFYLGIEDLRKIRKLKKGVEYYKNHFSAIAEYHAFKKSIKREQEEVAAKKLREEKEKERRLERERLELVDDLRQKFKLIEFKARRPETQFVYYSKLKYILVNPHINRIYLPFGKIDLKSEDVKLLKRYRRMLNDVRVILYCTLIDTYDNYTTWKYIMVNHNLKISNRIHTGEDKDIAVQLKSSDYLCNEDGREEYMHELSRQSYMIYYNVCVPKEIIDHIDTLKDLFDKRIYELEDIGDEVVKRSNHSSKQIGDSVLNVKCADDWVGIYTGCKSGGKVAIRIPYDEFYDMDDRDTMLDARDIMTQCENYYEEDDEYNY